MGKIREIIFIFYALADIMLWSLMFPLAYKSFLFYIYAKGRAFAWNLSIGKNLSTNTIYMPKGELLLETCQLGKTCRPIPPATSCIHLSLILCCTLATSCIHLYLSLCFLSCHIAILTSANPYHFVVHCVMPYRYFHSCRKEIRWTYID